jgi:hypothetical protein
MIYDIKEFLLKEHKIFVVSIYLDENLELKLDD